LLAVLFALTLRGPLAESVWQAPYAAFWLVVVITALCAAGALIVVALGRSRRLAELSILGSCLFTASVFPLVHGLTIPGVLYGGNPATSAAAFMAVPAAVLVAAPLLAPDAPLSRAIALRWGLWTTATMAATTAFAVFLLVDPELLPAPRLGQPLPYAVLLVSLLGTLALSRRQLRLYRLGRRGASLIAAVGFAYLGLSTLVYLVEQPYSVGWWSAHLIDAVGVLAAVIGLAFAHARDRSLAATLAPVLNRDPLVALELGLTPVVNSLIAALERKDPLTRDHVVRVGELSMRAGVRAGLDGSRLRNLGIGALLHDVGKLFTPDEILSKPGLLTDREFETIKDHSGHGAELMSTSPLLAPASDLVRWHHERADGKGYPDGLLANRLPVEAGLISVCDGWDAMTSMRTYRNAMTDEQASEILLEGAGSQWTDAAVNIVLTELRENGPVAESAYDELGRALAAEAALRDTRPLEVCSDALPATLGITVPG
jgi:HD-GYP domain-containing protein (c-di-GMP phosphodiesterase class II)